MKLLEYKNEIKTKQVYLNIIIGDEVRTKTLLTEEALKQYGDYTVDDFEGPEIVEEMTFNNNITSIVIKK